MDIGVARAGAAFGVRRAAMAIYTNVGVVAAGGEG